MLDLDLNALSLKELRQLQKDVTRAIDSYEERQKAEARTKLEAMAKEMGYSLSDLAPAEGKAAKAPKFCHPDDPRLTWSGRGRKPRWYNDAIEAGYTPDQLLIANRS